MTSIEIAVRFSKQIESLLVDKLGARGKGLHEKLTSVEKHIPAQLQKKIRKIATVRNKAVHENNFDIPDIDQFSMICEQVIHELNALEIKQNIDIVPIIRRTLLVLINIVIYIYFVHRGGQVKNILEFMGMKNGNIFSLRLEDIFGSEIRSLFSIYSEYALFVFITFLLGVFILIPLDKMFYKFSQASIGGRISSILSFVIDCNLIIIVFCTLVFINGWIFDWFRNAYNYIQRLVMNILKKEI